MSNVTTVIVCIVTFLFGLFTFVCILPITEQTATQMQNERATNTLVTNPKTQEKTESVISPLVYSKIYFVGDVMMARNVENIMQSYGASYPFSYLPKVASTSYLVGNFEASVPKIHTPTQSMGFSFSVKPDYIQQLDAYGFTHMSLANNHSYDFGSDDFFTYSDNTAKRKP